MRLIKPEDLVGKTIKSIDTRAVNVLVLTFADDTMVELWAETAVVTQDGDIPGIFIEDNPDPEDLHMVEVEGDYPGESAVEFLKPTFDPNDPNIN